MGLRLRASLGLMRDCATAPIRMACKLDSAKSRTRMRGGLFSSIGLCRQSDRSWPRLPLLLSLGILQHTRRAMPVRPNSWSRRQST
eukprot:3930462-Pyramimonas_sp.AAC.1